MGHEGKYMYGIIATDGDPSFGPIGIGGKKDEVVTVGTNGLAAVISNAPLDHYEFSKDNLTTHTRVIERVAEDFTILPMHFCTVAESTDEIIAFLEDRGRELKNSLRDLEGKVEIGIRVVWKDMKKIYEELVQENRTIRSLKQKGAAGGQQALVRAGELVEAALEEKKAVEGEEYMRPLKKVAVKYKEGEPKTEDVVVTGSFLVDRDWIKEFDAQTERIGGQHNGRIDVKYVGPMAPFSFVSLEMNGGRGYERRSPPL